MILTLEQVEHIAKLAHLELTGDEKDRYREQLSEILSYFNQLQSVDTTDISPTSGILPVHGALRPDEPRPGLNLDEILRNASQTEDGQFRIPPVFG